MAERFAFTRVTLRDLPVPDQKTVLVHDDVVRGLKITISPSGLKSFRLIRKFKGRPLRSRSAPSIPTFQKHVKFLMAPSYST
jgi:hypothetical protein